MRALLRPGLLLRAALSLAAAPLAGAAPPAAAPRPGATALPDPSRTAPAQLWDELLEHADFAAVKRSVELVDTLERTGGENFDVDPAACRRQAAALDDALRTAPVSLALWYASYRCAEAGGDAARADHDLQAFHALVKHAFDTLPPDNGLTPLRVLAERDVDAFVRASGQTLLFAFYDPGRGDPRRLPLVLSLWDDETQSERLLSFDFFDSLMHLNRNQRFAEFPLFRRGVRTKLLENMAKSPGSAAESGWAVQQALQQADAAARIDALKTAAAQGHYGAALALGGACFNAPALACAGDAVDALLPWAEQHNATALAVLALAYERGQGTAQDIAAARALVAAADRRLGGHRGTLMYAGLSGKRAPDPVSPVVADTLATLAREGDARVETYLAARAAAGRQGLDGALRRGLEHAAAAGVPQAQSLLGALLLEEKQAEAAAPWLQKAAAADVAEAQDLLGLLYAEGHGVAADDAQALAWWVRAGQGGDVDAMLRVARHWLGQPDAADARFRAQGWLQSAADRGNAEAIRRLADLYASGAEGLDGGRNEALALLRDLAQRPQEAASRRQLATLLLRDPAAPAADRAEARRLLEQDARADDAASQFQLAEQLLRGRFGQAEPREGMRWLQRAAEHDADAGVFLASVVYYGNFGVRRDAAAGIARWRKLAATDVRWARNNLAWALCTAPEEKLRDAAAGLAIADTMEASGDPLPLAFLDTIAACHAARGDFAGALEREQRALDLAQKQNPALESFIARARARIDDYRAGRAYLEYPQEPRD